MQAMVTLVPEKHDDRTNGTRSMQGVIAARTARSTSSPLPEPEPPRLPDGEPEPSAPFWTWFIENPRAWKTERPVALV